MQRKPLPGTVISIIWLPKCRNVRQGKNPYIGMEGIVVYDGNNISIFTGTSWLVLSGNFVWRFVY
jgi:hypothetical protein